jgi:hypothetical protein
MAKKYVMYIAESYRVVAGPKAAICTTACDDLVVSPTIAVSTKLNNGSLSQIRIVVAVNMSNDLYDGKTSEVVETEEESEVGVDADTVDACVSDFECVPLTASVMNPFRSSVTASSNEDTR